MINVIEYEAGKILVISSFEENRDVEETAQIISSIDSVGRSLIEYPCRSLRCQHIGVFDLKVWLLFNEKERKWLCPICQKKLELDQLYIDGYFKTIFQTVASESVTEICVHPDGSWTKPNNTIKTEDDRIIIDLTNLESDDDMDIGKSIYIKPEPDHD